MLLAGELIFIRPAFAAEAPERIPTIHEAAASDALPDRHHITIPTIDLSGEINPADFKRHVVLAQGTEEENWQHPHMLLMPDGRTIFATWTLGHGGTCGYLKRSDDGGRTWSERLPTPQSWATSREVPTIHRVVGPEGTKRLILWSGLYPARLAVSEDDGRSWTELIPAGEWGGIVVMGFVEALKTGNGHYLAMFHDDGRFFTAKGTRSGTFKLYKTFSRDGGLTWSVP